MDYDWKKCIFNTKVKKFSIPFKKKLHIKNFYFI